MYAVIQTGGRQYRVESGETLDVELLKVGDGEQVTFDDVLLIGDGGDVQVGKPVVEGAAVNATVLGRSKGPKLIIFKHSGRSTYRKKTGHRQHYTRLRIDSITV
ncbi:MAG: 50S ribosomal protein L21 [Proteobacteria bacterium]|nr:50S ribosomal protein L21 [Pseudomonadota bacterium]